jgi:hypothetical protein
MSTIVIAIAVGAFAYFLGKLKRKKFVLPAWEENILVAFKEFRIEAGLLKSDSVDKLEATVIKEMEKEIARIRE